MYNVTVVESLNAFVGKCGFFPGAKVKFETLEEAYQWAKVPIEQGSIVLFDTEDEEQGF